MGLLKSIFTWWNGATVGTRFFTKRHGERVGEDEFGNTYYRNADDSRRWVIYAGVAEASTVTPEWHGWLHHTFELPPTESPLKKWEWEAPAVPNMTGTAQAYRPPGSLLHPQPVPIEELDGYTAWKPE